MCSSVKFDSSWDHVFISEVLDICMVETMCSSVKLEISGGD